MTLRHKPPGLTEEELERYEAFVASGRPKKQPHPENKILQLAGAILLFAIILFAEGVLRAFGT